MPNHLELFLRVDDLLTSLDQMGVELGKVLAKAILGQLETPADVKGHDSSVST